MQAERINLQPRPEPADMGAAARCQRIGKRKEKHMLTLLLTEEEILELRAHLVAWEQEDANAAKLQQKLATMPAGNVNLTPDELEVAEDAMCVEMEGESAAAKGLWSRLNAIQVPRSNPNPFELDPYDHGHVVIRPR